MNMIDRTVTATLVLWGLLCYSVVAAPFNLRSPNQFVYFSNSPQRFTVSTPEHIAPILIDANEDPGVVRAVKFLQADMKNVTSQEPVLLTARKELGSVIIIGSLDRSELIKEMVKAGKIDVRELIGKKESSITEVITNPLPGIKQALVIVGSDKRGTIYGLFDLSRQCGVSPWYWWADVPVKKNKNLSVEPGRYVSTQPKVTYRGIFINDEAPALTGWSRVTFGGFNHKFYERVFELILRLNGNFLWPAMWGSAFFDDDPLNGPLANEMGIVIGTSHHEPMGRAHDEWRRYGSGPWDYSKNPKILNEFWKTGFERMKDFETIVTVGMRGDGDEPMTEQANIKLLEKVIKEQRTIMSKVADKKSDMVPQVWALYKEVQDYYDKGMRVPDDVTLLLCDDNWGNVRKLPLLTAPKRKGGYGMYYHFDYVGGPRNYKWLNVSQVSRIWEQMNLTWQHGVDKIWVVNVGDIKPMEYPITFFLDMAWNPDYFNPNNLFDHTVAFCDEQFGGTHSEKIAHIINTYTKYNRRVTPELLDASTYSLENYDEFETVTNDYQNLLLEAFKVYYLLPAQYHDAYEQLVLWPVHGMANLYQMYFAVAKNRALASRNDLAANEWADVAKECFIKDSLLTHRYNNVIAGGKWPHMMDQIRIGYTYWQQPRQRVMPAVTRVAGNPTPNSQLVFVEKDGYISIEAPHYSRKNNTEKIFWQIIPDLGKTSSGITTMPANAYQDPNENVSLEYDVYFESSGEVDVMVLLSPTLNFNENKGLRYAISLDGQPEQVVNFNQTYDIKLMEKWQANSINKTITKHLISTPGFSTVKFRALDPGIVLQKIIINTGGLKPSYLGPPESARVERASIVKL